MTPLLRNTQPSRSSWQHTERSLQLPILSSTQTRLKSLLRDPSVTYERLAHLVEQDPVLCWHLQVAIRQHQTNGHARVNMNALAGVSMLGLQRVVSLAKNLHTTLPDSDKKDSDKKNDKNNDASRHYQTALHVGALSGELAHEFAQALHMSNHDDVRWQALLSQAPLWPWFHQHHDACQQMLHHLSAGRTWEHAITQSFGNETKPWRSLATRMQLPRATQALLQPETNLTPNQWRQLRTHNRNNPTPQALERDLRHLCHQTHIIVMLANQLSWQLHVHPSGAHTKRWLFITASVLEKPISAVSAWVRQAQLRNATYTNTPHSSGLSLLLSPSRHAHPYPALLEDLREDLFEEVRADLRKEIRPATAQAPIDTALNNQNADQKTAQTTRQQTLRTLMERLDHNPSFFGDWHQMMQHMLKGASDGLNVSGACILLKTKDQRHINTVYLQHNQRHPLEGDNARALSQLSIELSGTHLFTKLLHQTAHIRLTPKTAAAHLQQLPEAIQRAIPSQCAMMSIHAGKAPIGVVMVFNHNKGISDDTFEAFKRLCTTTSHGLVQLRQQAKPQKMAAS